VTGLAWGPQAAFGNNGFFSSLGILPIFIVTNLLLIAFIWRRYRSEFSWWRHGLLPIAGAIVFTAALWFSVVPLPAAPLNTFPLIIGAWIVVGLAFMVWLNRRDPRRLDVIGQTMFVESETPAPIQELPPTDQGLPVKVGL
jgi:amino acid transporter